MISIVRNGIIIMPPQVIPKTWTDPDTEGIQWSNFDNTSIEALDALGRKDVVDEPPNYDPIYESRAAGEWYFDDVADVVTRNYTVEDRPIEDVRAERLAAVRAECKSGLLAVISIEHQMDIALGIDPDIGYTNWIAAMRIESNRCEDLYITAVTMADIKAIVWNFPAYTGGV